MCIQEGGVAVDHPVARRGAAVKRIGLCDFQEVERVQHGYCLWDEPMAGICSQACRRAAAGCPGRHVDLDVDFPIEEGAERPEGRKRRNRAYGKRHLEEPH
jgi:hypothetical protein